MPEYLSNVLDFRFIRREYYYSGIEMYLYNINGESQSPIISFADSVKFVPIKNIMEIRKPLLVISNDNAQKIMDDLWNCGMRPSEGTGSAGSLKATQNHLDDMRKLLFHTLNLNVK